MNPHLEPYTLEKRVRLRRFMYLPPLDGAFGEAAVFLGPTWLVHLDLLLNCDRLTQLTFTAARQLHYKIVLFETASYFDPASFNPDMN